MCLPLLSELGKEDTSRNYKHSAPLALNAGNIGRELRTPFK